MDMDREQSVQHFLDLIKKSHRGKFKIYIGMIAGVGKSYRMLQLVGQHPAVSLVQHKFLPL